MSSPRSWAPVRPPIFSASLLPHLALSGPTASQAHLHFISLAPTAALISAQTVLSSYGLTDQLSIDDYMKELDALKEVRFRQVQPMVGAVELVQHLVG